MEKIVVKNVSRTYYDPGGNLFTALDHVSLTWSKGESIAIMGESGSGKSKLARLLIGLEKPSSGAIFIDDQDIARLSNRRWLRYRTDLQAVFQDERGTLSPTRFQRLEPFKTLNARTNIPLFFPMKIHTTVF